MDKKEREYAKRYYNIHQEERKEYQKKYRGAHPQEVKEYYNTHSEKFKKKGRDRYLTHLRETKEYNQNYYLSYKEQIKEKVIRYCHTPEGHKNKKKNRFKRRSLGFMPLNKHFTDSDAHHIDEQRVIYMPKEMHQSVYHSVFKNTNMRIINILAFRWLESEELNNLALR